MYFDKNKMAAVCLLQYTILNLDYQRSNQKFSNVSKGQCDPIVEVNRRISMSDNNLFMPSIILF